MKEASCVTAFEKQHMGRNFGPIGSSNLKNK